HQVWPLRTVSTREAIDLSTNVALGIDADGGFAAYCKVPDRTATGSPAETPPSQAPPADPPAPVQNGSRKPGPFPGGTAALLGAGAIGCLFLLSLRASGVSQIWVVDPAPGRRQEAIRLGATSAVHSIAELDEAKASGALSSPGVVIDAVGQCLGDAINAVGD